MWTSIFAPSPAVSDASDAPLHDFSGVHHSAGVSTIPAASPPARTPGQDGRPRDHASTLASAPPSTPEPAGHRRLNPVSAPASAPASTREQLGAHPTSTTAMPQPVPPSDAADAPPALSDAPGTTERQNDFPHADADLPVASDASDARLHDFSGVHLCTLGTPARARLLDAPPRLLMPFLPSQP